MLIHAKKNFVREPNKRLTIIIFETQDWQWRKMETFTFHLTPLSIVGFFCHVLKNRADILSWFLI